MKTWTVKEQIFVPVTSAKYEKELARVLQTYVVKSAKFLDRFWLFGKNQYCKRSKTIFQCLALHDSDVLEI